MLGYLARANRPSDATTLITGVIAGSPCVKLTNDPPKAVVWIARQIARLNPYMLYPIRNKPEVFFNLLVWFLAVLTASQDLSRNEETNSSYANDPFVSTPGSLRSLDDMITEVTTFSMIKISLNASCSIGREIADRQLRLLA